MNKISTKEMMEKAKLRNNFLLNRTEENQEKPSNKDTFVYHYQKTNQNDFNSLIIGKS